MLFCRPAPSILLALLLLAPAIAQSPVELQKDYQVRLEQLGQISVEQFISLFQPEDTPAQQWDPATAQFWKELNSPPLETPRGTKPDLRPTPQELKVLAEKGFVVSERLGRDTMTGVLYRIYSADLPIFVSADCVLHAWHQSFDSVCGDIENTYLGPTMDTVFSAMHGELATARAESSLSKESVRDADLILTVTLSLLHERQEKSVLGQDGEVSRILALCAAEDESNIAIFGRSPARLDFSALQVRGRYERRKELRGYFRASTWCRLSSLNLSVEREADTALVLADLLKRSGKQEQWIKFENTLSRLFGPIDGLGMSRLSKLISDTGNLPESREELLRGSLGVEVIPSYKLLSPMAQGPTKEQRRFFLAGASFTPGSWVLSQTVFGQVRWNDERVQRRIPSGLDVCFALLANSGLVNELARRMEGTGVRFRDGLNYQHNLAALRQTLDSQSEQWWRASIPSHWDLALRRLSQVPDNAPDVARSSAWRRRCANTQLASWSQLRYNIMAQAKPSETMGTLCSYPQGYVEPVPEFWSEMSLLCQAMSQLSEDCGLASKRAFYQGFETHMKMLESISKKQLRQQPLDAKEAKFLQDMVEIESPRSGGGHFTGWYFSLFSTWHKEIPERWSPTVVDVHVSPADAVSGAPGSVLLQGVGAADLMIVAIENGSDRCLYLGPVSSFYEWNSGGRMTDSEWVTMVESGLAPDRPSWTKDFWVKAK